MVVCPSGPGSFRLDGYDDWIHTREAICIGSTRIWCSLQLLNPLGRQLTQTSGVRAACGGCELIALAQCNPGCLDKEIRYGGALGDRPLEQPRGRWRYQVRSRVYRARRLASERYVAGVAAEVCDIGLYPAEGGLLIEDAVVATGMTF